MKAREGTALTKTKRPTLWLAIAVLLLWGALAATLAAISLLFPGTWLDAMWVLNPRAHEGLVALPKFVGYFFLTLGLVLLITGIGWIRRRFWGWALASLLIAGNLAGDLLRFAHGEWVAGTVGVVVAGALLVYMLRRNVRGFFLKQA